MMMKFEMIEMPVASEVRAISNMRKEEIHQAGMMRRKRAEQEAFNDIPRFIHFINEQIEVAKMRGDNSISINFVSSGKALTDRRCSYSFKGEPTYEHMKFIEQTYAGLGFEASARLISCYNYLVRYRDGEVIISW